MTTPRLAGYTLESRAAHLVLGSLDYEFSKLGAMFTLPCLKTSVKRTYSVGHSSLSRVEYY